MGRGKSVENVRLIFAAEDILREIQPCSVRAVCYQLFNRKLIPSMRKNDTNRVSVQLVDAREAGFIPWEWIVDETREAECINAWENPAAYIETVRRAYRRDRWTDQPYHIEVWSEKGTVRGTLAPVLNTYGVTFRVLHGYGSATVLHDVAEASQSGKPWIVLYVGDWDPSGLHMSEVDLPGRVERYGGDITLKRVALTAAHVAEIDPRLSFAAIEKRGTKRKRGDARYAWFVANHGSRCWELDALAPPLLRDAVEQEILQYIDDDAWERAERAEEAERESLATILDAWPGISRQAQKYETDSDDAL